MLDLEPRRRGRRWLARLLPLTLLTTGCIVGLEVGDDRGGDEPESSGDTGSTTEGQEQSQMPTGGPVATDGTTGEPEACFGEPDESSCMDAGCNHFEMVTEITETCECVPGLPACLRFTGGIGGSDSPDYFWHEATLTVAMFDTSWAEYPVGWRSCADADAPPACGCYEPFMAPACP